MKRKAPKPFTVGSLIDANPSDYTTTFYPDGTVKHHYAGSLAHLNREQETQEEEKPIEDKNQLTIKF